MRSSKPPIRWRAAGLTGLLAAAFGCAATGDGAGDGVSPPDRDPPVVSGTVPPTGAIDVAVDVALRVEFDEVLDATTVGTGSFSLFAGGQPVAGTLLHQAGSSRVTFRPVAPLHFGAAHTATIAASVADPAGNTLGIPFSWSFTTVVSLDTSAPVLVWSEPSGIFPAGVTRATLRVMTDEVATCRWDALADTTYAAMPNTFATTGAISHSTEATGLSDGQAYTYYVRCQDLAGNANATSFAVTFSIASPSQFPSAGCAVPQTGSGEFETETISVGTAMRTFHIRVPATYDGAVAYPLIFRWHGAGSSGVDSDLPIERSCGDTALVVAGDAAGELWDSAAGSADLDFFDAMLAEISDSYCIALDRVYTYGFSSGGGLTNLLACVRGNVLRANAVVSGSDRGPPICVGPIAALIVHDTDDMVVPIQGGIEARDHMLAIDGCGADTTAQYPFPCVRYLGCDPDNPVVWCQTSGREHEPQADWVPEAAWSFFRNLP